MTVNMRRWIVLLACVLVSALFVLPTFAAGESPQAAAENIRQILFEAQSDLMEANQADAAAALENAHTAYLDSLAEMLKTNSPDVAERIEASFTAAAAAIQAGDNAGLAAARGQIWTEMLGGSTTIILNALENGDANLAHDWLLLREYRVSTKFSRPGADATLAVNNLLQNKIKPSEALEAVRADLYDTYQSQLNDSLSDADQGDQRGYNMKRAEESALANGYFQILAEAYSEQLGAEALAQAQDAFTALSKAAAANDAVGFARARSAANTALLGFRAAPLSDQEQARRAGQMLRFASLVAVEYGRGVQDGQIIHDIEIQEARTFHEGVTAAFADLQPALRAIDTEKTTQAGALIAQLLTQMNSVVAPSDVQATTDQLISTLNSIFPESWKNSNTDSDMDVIFSVLEQVENAAAQGQYDLAESARLEAYALLEMGLEQKLRGFAPDLAFRVESLFWQGSSVRPGLAYLLTTLAPMGEIKATLGELRAALGEAQTTISAGKSAPGAVAGNAAVIIFREGLEAVLILASLLASLRTAEEQRYRRPIVVGAGLALLGTGLTWVVANALLTVLLPLGERLEAVVSLIAIAVLLVITNWFFHKVYWTGWMAGFHTRKRAIIGGARMIAIGQVIGLVILGFTSVYREGFESVLFLQSLVLEAGLGVVIQGVILGMVGVAIVGYITFRLQVRLPYKKMLIVTGIMIGVVLLTMVGHTVNTLQSVGWLPITPIPNVYLPLWVGQWFGFFATWQAVVLQIIAATFVIGSYFWAERINHRKRDTSKERNPNQQATAG